jgi:succinyl-CoA synthetase beta subunit
MDSLRNIIDDALSKKERTLSEYESKLFIKHFGVNVTDEYIAKTIDEALSFADKLGYPVVMKGVSRALAHKTEMNMVRLGIQGPEDLKNVFKELNSAGLNLDGILIQQSINGKRELVIGMKRDPNFGPAVMFGIGGVFTEVLDDVSFRIAPLSESDAVEMISEIKFQKILGEFRGSPRVDIKKLSSMLIGIGELALKYHEISEIDINPIIVQGNDPIAVDALIVL